MFKVSGDEIRGTLAIRMAQIEKGCQAIEDIQDACIKGQAAARRRDDPYKESYYQEINAALEAKKSDLETEYEAVDRWCQRFLSQETYTLSATDIGLIDDIVGGWDLGEPDPA